MTQLLITITILVATKNLVVHALSHQPNKHIWDYKQIERKNCMELLNKEIEYFILEDSMKFFSAFQTETSFFKKMHHTGWRMKPIRSRWSTMLQREALN